LTAVHLWLRAVDVPPGSKTGTPINNRHGQNILNVTGGGLTVYDTVAVRGQDADGDDVEGNIVWQMDPADNTYVGEIGTTEEDHEAVLDFRWTSGGQPRRKPHPIQIRVSDLVAVRS